MKALVIGASRSGSSVTRLLLKKGYEVLLTDNKKIDNKKELEALGAKIYDGGHPDFLLEKKYDLVIKNPGIPYRVPFVKALIEKGYFIYNEIEVAASVSDYKFGAITGTNGKTTTTTLLGEFLKTLNPLNEAVGNIGKPLSEKVYENEDEKLELAIEVAAFQLLGMPEFKPLVSTITNLTPDHLDYFSSLDEYYKAKCLIYSNQDKNDYFIKNIDDDKINEYVTDIKSNVKTLSLDRNADITVHDGYACYEDVRLFKVSDLKLVGKHNLYNSLTAASMAYLLGVAPADIQKVVEVFGGVEHRLEFVREVNQVRYYNDSKGTNTDATITALKAFEKPVILLAGGYDKKTGFKDLIPYLDKVKQMIVFGETKYQLKELYPDADICETMEEAIHISKGLAEPGDVVLLSPSCASWDQFENFEQRGEIFKNIVKKL